MEKAIHCIFKCCFFVVFFVGFLNLNQNKLKKYQMLHDKIVSNFVCSLRMALSTRTQKIRLFTYFPYTRYANYELFEVNVGSEQLQPADTSNIFLSTQQFLSTVMQTSFHQLCVYNSFRRFVKSRECKMLTFTSRNFS